MANLTPEEISEILAQFFDVTGKRQYIGARYVPIFGRKEETSIEWDNSKPYEPLTIVLYQGNSYTSRTYVPTGVDISDDQYWANTGNYNAQVEAYRQEVLAFDNRIDTLEDSTVVLNGFVETSTPKLQYVTPDNYVGTDTEKLQQAFDAVSNTIERTIIVLNREYTLENNIYIDNNSDYNVNGIYSYISVIGIGESASISFGANCITSHNTISGDDSQANGGVTFNNITFVDASSKCFDMDTLLRLSFLNCRFYNNQTVFSCATYYIQSLSCSNCYFKKIGKVVYSNGSSYDISFIGCVIEGIQDTVFQYDTGSYLNTRVISCCIEGAENVFYGTGTLRGFLVEACYFEGDHTSYFNFINTPIRQVSICDNTFVIAIESTRNTAKAPIKLGASVTGTLVVTGNYLFNENNNIALFSYTGTNMNNYRGITCNGNSWKYLNIPRVTFSYYCVCDATGNLIPSIPVPMTINETYELTLINIIGVGNLDLENVREISVTHINKEFGYVRVIPITDASVQASLANAKLQVQGHVVPVSE